MRVTIGDKACAVLIAFTHPPRSSLATSAAAGGLGGSCCRDADADAAEGAEDGGVLITIRVDGRDGQYWLQMGPDEAQIRDALRSGQCRLCRLCHQGIVSRSLLRACCELIVSLLSAPQAGVLSTQMLNQLRRGYPFRYPAFCCFNNSDNNSLR